MCTAARRCRVTWMDGSMDGWMDRWIDRPIDRPEYSIAIDRSIGARTRENHHAMVASLRSGDRSIRKSGMLSTS